MTPQINGSGTGRASTSRRARRCSGSISTYGGASRRGSAQVSAQDSFGATSRASTTLQSFGLDALLSGAARLRAKRTALAWSGEGVAPGAMTYAEWDEAANRAAGALATCGFAPGERALIVGAADPATLTLLFGAVRAGLDVALCPAGEPVERIAERAQSSAAAAILAPARIGAASVEIEVAQAAARSDQVRLAAVWGETGGASTACSLCTRSTPNL
ncbi:MAG: AMP-binding protein [Rhodoblastus sp.]|nr:MAG: AMP-binding protein [Rhodoblastus sp.]